MTVPRSRTLALAATLLAAACSDSPDAAAPAPDPASSRPSSGKPTEKPAKKPTARPSPSPTSPFCLNLTLFQVGVIAYSSDVGAAIDGEPLDFKELRRKADVIARTGEPMRASAPPDIADELRTVLKAIETSAGHLKEGGDAWAVLGPVYGDRHRPAFDAVNAYNCGGGGG
ncbi:hypothetical protein [Streptomyces sp. MAR4 CNX-425]|uniref:hypothetical protein n=1 Tax=Streptomyces sp. MAR4 CNX-425 TaxID=3406343 RepID=UPI003B51194E